jgi:hypothetical protein
MNRLVKILLEKGDRRAALAEMQQEPFELQRLVGLSMAYHALGQKAESDSALDDLIQKGEKTNALQHLLRDGLPRRDQPHVSVAGESN